MSKKTKITVVLAVVLATVVALAAGIWFITRPETDDGAKDITFTVVYKDATREEFKINTDAKYLADALVEEGIITYEESGIYSTINGVTADYSVDGGWWCIYVEGESSNLGMNELPVTDGGNYEAVYTIGFVA